MALKFPGSIFLMLIIPGLSHHATAHPVDNSRCDTLYQAVIQMRNDIYYKRSTILYQEAADRVQFIVRTYYDKIFGVTVDDSDKLREVVCKITEIPSLEEFAHYVHCTFEGLKGTLELWRYVYKEMFVKEWSVGKQYLINIRAWMSKSGFPDDWPLNVTYDETSDLFTGIKIPGYNNTYWRQSYFHSSELESRRILAFGQPLLSTETVVRALTEARSLADYLRRISVTRRGPHSKFDMFYSYIHRLKEDSVYRDIITAQQSLFNFMEAVSQIIVTQFKDLFKEHYLYFDDEEEYTPY